MKKRTRARDPFTLSIDIEGERMPIIFEVHEDMSGAEPITKMCRRKRIVLWVAGIGWTDDELAAIVNVHYRAELAACPTGRFQEQLSELVGFRVPRRKKN